MNEQKKNQNCNLRSLIRSAPAPNNEKVKKSMNKKKPVVVVGPEIENFVIFSRFLCNLSSCCFSEQNFVIACG
jgi:hypothetical protein